MVDPPLQTQHHLESGNELNVLFDKMTISFQLE